MSSCSPPNKVVFPRKELSDVEQRIREKLQERKMDQNLDVLDKDPEVELEEGKKFLVNMLCLVTVHVLHCHTKLIVL